MDRPSVDQVRAVIGALYNDSDPNGKEKASEWLHELQRSVYAWEIADQLLRLNISVETSYFAAQTMRTKVQYYFYELQPAQYQSLKDSLLDHLCTLHSVSHAIVTQLCLTLADLAVQMPQWREVVNDLCQRFGTTVERLPVLLEILTVLPEEVGSHHLRVGANRREDVTQELRASAATVLNLLTACVSQFPTDTNVKIRMFRCAGSWVTLSAFPPIEFVRSDLLQSTFNVLHEADCNDLLHEVAADFICNALYTSENLENQEQLAEGLFQYVMMLPPAYEKAVQSEDFDRALNICRVFTEMGESFLPVIVQSPGRSLGDLGTLTIILTCVKHYQYEVAEVTFNFWYRLSEALYKTEDEAKAALFRPYFESLLEALCVHCRLETDAQGIPDDCDEFGEFRLRVADLIKDCVFIVGSGNCFSQMYNSIVQQGNAVPWEATEAVLFVMSTVARNVPSNLEVVGHCLPLVLNLPSSLHVAVRHTSIKLVGELAEWIKTHPEYLDPILQFLLSTVQDPKLSSVSASAIESLCIACHSQMTKYFDVLAQVVVAADSLSISSDSYIGLLKGVCKVLEGIESEQLSEGLNSICGIHVTSLKQILSAPANSYPDPTLWLDRLAATFRYVNPKVENGTKHPALTVVEEVWPILSNICDKYRADLKIIERCCRCIRFAIRCLGKSAINLLSPLVSQMVSVYGTNPHSCFLYLGSILVDEYGDEAGCVPGLIGMTMAFCGPAFQLLSQEKGMIEHPDTIDDLFRLCGRCLQKCPLAFLKCDVAVPAIQCAIVASTLEHRDANLSVMKFIKSLVSCATEKSRNDIQERLSLVQKILAVHGQNIMTGLIQACAGALPSYMVMDVSEVLWEFITFCPEETSKWVEVALQSIQTQIVPGSLIATPQQLHDFHNDLIGSSNHDAVWKASKRFSRLFR
ncbi:transportin-3-like [Stylophora pistillata]|uniref:transportin-3-like n=1 Tax=Stylophora pistillata TaxID=50429 RepID=UPI000C04B12B|nr:transportin-3-like [Stylophora pistillata]